MSQGTVAVVAGAGEYSGTRPPLPSQHVRGQLQ